ncbi:MAG: LysR family transcriptional regulator [Actinomycetota bacterium]
MEVPVLNLTTHQLQYLVTISRSNTMADAAKELHISPSALSQGLSELERRLGLQLFQRTGRNRTLTNQGHQVVRHAERILAATRDLTVWVDDALKGERGQVRLGLIDIAAVSYFPETLIRYRSARPQIDLQLSIGPSANLTRQLLDGQLDAAVIVAPADSADRDPADPTAALTMVELFTEELAIYAPGSVPGGAPVAADDPARWGPWITFPPESHTRRHIARALRDLGAEFRVEAESHQPEVLRQMVNLGMGWTVLPVLQAETEPNPLQRAREEPLLSRRLVIATRSGSPQDAALTDLLDRLQASAAARS